MVFSQLRFWSRVRVQLLIGVLASLLLLFFIRVSPPELIALTQADLLAVSTHDLDDQVPSVTAGSMFSSLAGGNTHQYSEPIRLPFLKVREQKIGLEKFTYSITLDDRALGSSRVKLDTVALKLESKYGLFFPQITNGGDFYLNGYLVAGLPGSTTEERRMWFVPFVVPLPSHLLKRDGTPNVLTVLQTSLEPSISIPQPYFGTMEELIRVSRVTRFLSVTLANAFNVLCLGVGLLLLAVWIASPKQSIYAWAGCASILWSLLLIFFRLSHSSMDLRELWRWTAYLCEGGLISLHTIFVLSFIGQPPAKRTRRALMGLASIAPIVYAAGGGATERYLDFFWTPALLSVYVYAITRLMNFCWSTRSTRACVLVPTTLLFLVLGLHDYAVQSHLIDKFSDLGLQWGWPGLFFEPIYLTHLGMPVLLLFACYMLLSQHRDNIVNLDNSRFYLDATLQHQKVQLDTSYRRREVIALSQATLTERDRIYQDIHDGIGSQLVKAIFSLRKSETNSAAVVDNLQTCLQDLRLVIDAHQESNMDVQTAVFAFCEVQESHLQGSGVEINYNVGLGATVYADPKVNLNVLRVIQESLSNTLKYAGATSIMVGIELSASDLILSVTDNGRDLSADLPGLERSHYGLPGNRGIAGLALRAADIGGEYTIAITASGTKVRLSIPLPSDIKTASAI